MLLSAGCRVACRWGDLVAFASSLALAIANIAIRGSADDASTSAVAYDFILAEHHLVVN